jgi:hypothetical protein
MGDTMTTPTILLRTRRTASDQLEIDGLLQEILELRDRVSDLEMDAAALADTLHASVALNHKLTEDNARLKICVRRNLWDTYNDILDRQAAA